MMTIRDINKLSESERALAHASYQYYRALLHGASAATRQRLRQRWLVEQQRRWPDVWRGAWSGSTQVL